MNKQLAIRIKNVYLALISPQILMGFFLHPLTAVLSTVLVSAEIYTRLLK